MKTKQTTVCADLPEPNFDELELTRETSRKEVNTFLERDDVDHDLGGVTGWRACYGARYNGRLVGVCVVGRPTSRHLDHERVVEITRYASRPDRPGNMGSWLVSKAREWAAIEGYEKIIAYAGVAGNEGTLYTACGFELEEETQASGDGWTNRKGRDSWSDYTRKKWAYELDGARRV